MGSDGAKASCVTWGVSGAEGRCQFWDAFAITGFMGYDSGCMIASDTLFDSRFSGSSYPVKT